MASLCSLFPLQTLPLQSSFTPFPLNTKFSPAPALVNQLPWNFLPVGSLFQLTWENGYCYTRQTGFKLFFIGVQLLYNVVLVSVVWRSVSAMCIIYSLLLGPPSHSPPIPSCWVITEHQAKLLMLYNSFPPAICFIQGSVEMSIPISQFIPLPLIPPPCPQVLSLHLHLYSCPAISSSIPFF